MIMIVLATSILAQPTIASAAAGMQACAQIGDDQRRLACYDQLTGRAPLPVTQTTGRPVDADPAARQPMPVVTAQPQTADVSDAALSASDASGSLFDRAWSFEPENDRYLIKLYRPNYLNPVRYQSRTNDKPFDPLFNAFDTEDGDLDKVEAAFQISFKTRVWATDDRRFGVWFAYTQQSFWQVYNGDISSPFRDTNYMPELKVAWRPQWSFGGFDWRLLSLGYTHESNGRSDPISRSWDRLVAEIGLERDNFALLIRPWIRLDDSSSDEDNPDITDYYGYGDITAVYKWRGHSFTLMARGNPAEEKGAIRASWMTPKLIGPLRGYLVGFSGYGDTLIDYNFRQNAISIGVALNDVLDRE